MARRTKWDWSLMEWRDYYDGLRKKAENNYQESGMARYDREHHKYEVIVEAFDKAIEHDDERDNDRVRRMHNIDAYMDRYGAKDTFTKAELTRIVNDIKNM